MKNDNSINVKINGKYYKLCKYMFGVLEMNHNSPLSCVSEANNSFSIDYWKGCSFQCAYCHVQGIYEDLDNNFRMYKNPIPRSKFTIENIVDALISHKFFKKNDSLISIATSSTEPFANIQTTNNTLQIMEYFVKLGYTNPFWIVTKAGIPHSISKRLKKICDNGNKIMISICYANNPREIEPVQNNRFKNIEELKETGVVVSWYMRPLVKEWGANEKNLELMIKKISKQYYDYIDMIIPGGLRWTEGIEFGLQDIRGLKMPKLIKKYNKKTLSTTLENTIVRLCKKYFKNKPVYFHSSCGISHMLNKPNISLLNIFDVDTCNKLICHNKCKDLCNKRYFSNDELLEIEKELKQQNIDIELKDINETDKIVSIPDFNVLSYTIQQQIKKTIASSKKEKINETKQIN